MFNAKIAALSLTSACGITTALGQGFGYGFNATAGINAYPVGVYEVNFTSGVATPLVTYGPAQQSATAVTQPNGLAFASDRGADGMIFFADDSTRNLGFYDRSTMSFGSAGDLSAFGYTWASAVNAVRNGGYHNGGYYFVPNGTDDLVRAAVNGSGAITSVTKVVDLFATPPSGYTTGALLNGGDLVITTAGILYGTTTVDPDGAGGANPTGRFWTVDLNAATPSYTDIGLVNTSDAFLVNGLNQNGNSDVYRGLAYGTDGNVFGNYDFSSATPPSQDPSHRWYLIDPATGTGTLQSAGSLPYSLADLTRGSTTSVVPEASTWAVLGPVMLSGLWLLKRRNSARWPVSGSK